MKDVNGSTHLLRRGARYYFRQKVPLDLIEALGKREVKISLRTSDPTEARERVKVKAVEVAQMFADARAKATSPASEPSDSSLNEARLAILREAARRQKVEELEARFEHDPFVRYREVVAETHPHTTEEHRVTALDSVLEHEVDPWIGAVRDGYWEADVCAEVDTILEGQSVVLPAAEDDCEALRRLIAEGVLEGFLQFRDGTPSGSAAANSPVVDDRTGPTLPEVFDKWLEEKRPPKKTRMEFDSAVRELTKRTGAVPIGTITKADVRGYKEALAKRPGRKGERLAPATINKALTALSAVFAWAINNDYLGGGNPATGLKVVDPEKDKDKRLPFDDDDLKVIFGSPVFTQGARPDGGAGEAAYWLPILALYTGARLEELGQALLKDVGKRDGIIYLDLNTEGVGKRLKTPGSKRKIPLHPEILRLGFLDHVDRLRAGGTGRIFPDLTPDSRGALTGNWSKWFGRYLRDTIGIDDRRKVFHSFRHTFKDACRRAQISAEIHDALMGHAGRTVADSYGGEYPLEPLAEAVEKICFNGMPQLEPPDHR